MEFIEKKISPCRLACPVGTNVQGYIGLIAEHRYREALDLAREKNPFPATCGRLCFRPCETECIRGRYDEALMIADLKRFVADIVYSEDQVAQEPPLLHDDSIAIIGAGPAGLTAAWDLRRMGFPVTVFDQFDTPGGSLMHFLPSFLLPKDILKKEIDWILSHGIDFKGGVQLGGNKSIDDLRKEGFKAIILTLGSAHDFSFPSKWQLLDDIYWGPYLFLEKLKKEPEILSGMRILFLGTGTLTLTIARMALRARAREVQLWRRFVDDNMTLRMREVEEAQYEGLRIEYGKNIVNIERANGKALVTYKNALTYEKDKNERDIDNWCEREEQDQFDFVVDTRYIGPAGRQARILGLPTYGIMLFPMVNPKTLLSPYSDIYMAGDFVSGPKSIIEAIAGGHFVANTVCSHLGGKPLKEKEYSPSYEIPRGEPRAVYKQRLESLVIDCETNPEGETIAALDETQALAEANRCLKCGPCSECEVCNKSCEFFAYSMLKDKRLIRGIQGLENSLLKPLTPIINKDLCNACGSCIQACELCAISIVEGYASVDIGVCNSCFACQHTCKSGALLFLVDEG